VAIALPTRRQARAVVTRGGRHVFVMPWRGHSLIGTSDHPFEGTPDDVRPTARDVTDLIDDVTRALPGAEIGPEDVRYAFAGLYPLTDDALKADVYQGTGDYQIVDHARRDGVEGCLSVLGAKFTTARRVAERAVDVALEKLKRPAVPCRTSDTPLAGGEISDLAGFEEAVARKWPDMDGALARHLVSAYGTEIDDLLAVCREQTGWRRLAPERAAIEGEVHFAVDREMAVRLEDVIFRRTGLGTLGYPGDGCLRRCADIIGIRLGWTADRVADEIRRTELLFAVGSPAVRSPGR
jgi:glycerol-3-phosphate dehydrogenase